MVVKLTRTLSIIPTVLIFSLINARILAKENTDYTVTEKSVGKVSIRKIFPFFILLFLGMVALKSTGLIPAVVSTNVSTASKFLMVMALGAIGLKTNFKEMARSGVKPMLHGFIISALVVIVSFGVQYILGQI